MAPDEFPPAENLNGNFVHTGPFNIFARFTLNFERLERFSYDLEKWFR